MRITRRRFLAGGALGLAVTAAGVVYDTGRVTVTRNVLLDPADPRRMERPLRLVQLSDLHLRDFDDHARAVVNRVNSLDPDVVVFTGDSIDQPDALAILQAFLAGLSPRAEKFAVLGNWEHWARVDLNDLRATYASAGCRLLVNESIALNHSGHPVLITGLDDSTAGSPDLAAALSGRAPAANHVVLAHSPAYRDVLVNAAGTARSGEVAMFSGHPITCVLSGHTHGGQVNLLGWAPLRPPGSGRYVSGWYRESWPQLYVSRGIGTSVAPIRLGAPPEIAHFEWHMSDA